MGDSACFNVVLTPYESFDVVWRVISMFFDTEYHVELLTKPLV